VTRAGVARHDLERAGEKLPCPHEFAALKVHDTQHVDGVERVRVLGDHRFVQRDRFGVAARLLRSERCVESGPLRIRDSTGAGGRCKRAMTLLVALAAAARARSVTSRHAHR
jgi:hypothetical protein